MSATIGFSTKKSIRLGVSAGDPWAQVAVPLPWVGDVVRQMGFTATFEDPSEASSLILYYGFVSGPAHWVDSANTDLFCGCRLTLTYSSTTKQYTATSANVGMFYKIGATWYAALGTSDTTYRAATAARVENPFWGAMFAIKRRATGSDWTGYFPIGDWTDVNETLRDFRRAETVTNAINLWYDAGVKLPWRPLTTSNSGVVNSSTRPEQESGKTLDRAYIGIQHVTGAAALHIFSLGVREGKVDILNPSAS